MENPLKSGMVCESCRVKHLFRSMTAETDDGKEERVVVRRGKRM
jgi:hypothetical protein